jgi:hypothetical protein
MMAALVSVQQQQLYAAPAVDGLSAKEGSIGGCYHQ